MRDLQVYDIHSSTGITPAESDEFQRNWDDQMWERKTHENGANYDRTRAHLNFEVTKGGKVQPIDNSKTVNERMWDSLNARGIDPFRKRKTPNRRLLAKMIFGGSRELMHHLAYGDQHVDLARGADNSHITRCKDIEDWAKDIYAYVARKYGEDNIVGFYVHCDEVNPHVHCSIIPVTPDNEVQWNYWFNGDNKIHSSARFRDEHDAIAAINAKWGLKRGVDIHETGAKHRTTEEYRREATRLDSEIQGLNTEKDKVKSELDILYEEMNKTKRKIKGLTTMIENLTAEKSAIEDSIDGLRKQLGSSSSMSNAEIAKRINDLKSLVGTIDAKLKDKKQKLEEAEKQLEEIRSQTQKQKLLKDALQKQNTETITSINADTQMKLATASMSMLKDSLARLMPTLTTSQRQLLYTIPTDDSVGISLDAIAEKPVEVIECAMLLFVGFVDKATTYAESHGGGGGPGGGWRKKDDEDDFRFARRCIGAAARMMSSRSRGRKR